jgi:hypothetical protein
MPFEALTPLAPLSQRERGEQEEAFFDVSFSAELRITLL